MEQKSDVKNNGPELRMKLLTVESNLIPMNGTNLLLNLLMVRFITLLGLGLIKINTVLANFNNPRPSLIIS